MGFITNFLNPNAMSNEDIIRIADDIVNRECKEKISRIASGMIEIRELHTYVRDGGDPNTYIDFSRDFTNSLDWDYESLQSMASRFANMYANDLRVLSGSHPIIKLYSLIIDLNTTCKNYYICEYEVLETALNAKSEADATKKIMAIRQKSNIFLNENAKQLEILLKIFDNPRKVLNL